MRALALLTLVPIGILVWIVLVTSGPLRPAAAADRLAGVDVSLVGYRLEGTRGGDRRLRVTLHVTSTKNVDECLGFSLDEPFAARRMDPDPAGCVTPTAGSRDVEVVLAKLTDDDERFPEHTLVWGIPGGRCGPVLEAIGVCVVEQAGTLKVRLPDPPGTPSFPPIGSFPLGPVFSFPPFSFDP